MSYLKQYKTPKACHRKAPVRRLTREERRVDNYMVLFDELRQGIAIRLTVNKKTRWDS